MKKLITNHFVLFIVSVLLVCSLTSCSNRETQIQQPSSMPEETGMPEDSVVGKPAESGETGNSMASVDYAVGDIILADGSVEKAVDFTAIDKANFPIAVIAGFREDGKAFGVGVHRSDSPLQWAADDSNGYTTKFENIICTQDDDLVFDGDMDGSDNWEAVLSQDESGAVEAEKNYPAFHFVNTYADTYHITDVYTSSWYMPSVAELNKIYENRKKVNTALKKIYRLDSNAAMDGLDTNWYWSSSQAGSEDDYAWFIHYFNGYAGECPKNFTNVHVLTVRAFDRHACTECRRHFARQTASFCTAW